MKKYLILILTMAVLLFSACNSIKKTENNQEPSKKVISETDVMPEKISFTKETFPKVDGSTATIPLSQAIASSVVGLTKEESVKFIKHNTTHNAYVNLLDKKADIIFVTDPSKEELDMAKTAKVELEITPIVKEGFVFLVNKQNSVESLTTKQIQDIYQGKLKNWKEVGGQDKEITAYQREANSGSQTLMEQLVMKGLKMMESPKDIVPSMEGLIDNIAKYDNSDKALGYSVFYYAKTMYNNDSIKLLKVDGVAPTNASISSGKYPFVTSYYAVMRKDEPKDSSSRKLLAWILSSDGQKMAEDAGYVPLKER